MLKTVFIFLLFTCSLMAVSEYKPYQQIDVNSTARDIVVKNNLLYIGTDNGNLQVYDYVKKKFIKKIQLPKIKDFMGESVNPKVFSIDYEDGRYLLLSDSGEGGYSNLWIHENNITTQIISPKNKDAVIKARFIDKDHILLGFLGDEAALFDLKSKKEIYRHQLSPSKFSDFALNEDRSMAAFGCESGAINVINVRDGKIIKKLDGINKDNVYKVDFKAGTIVGAGQDRRASIYDLKSSKGDFIQGSFLIYAAALSPSAKRAAFAMDEDNDIFIYKLPSKENIAILKGQKSTLNAIIFETETTLFSSSDDNIVNMWKIDK